LGERKKTGKQKESPSKYRRTFFDTAGGRPRLVEERTLQKEGMGEESQKNPSRGRALSTASEQSKPVSGDLIKSVKNWII